MGNKPNKAHDNDDNKTEEAVRKPKEQQALEPLPDASEELDRKWREFCSRTIATFHRNRPQFIFLGTLSKSYHVKSIRNEQFGYWFKDSADNTPKCDTVFADFSVAFTLSYNDQKPIHLRLTALFNNKKYQLFDDNFATKDWTIKLILLEQELKKLWLLFFESLASSNKIFDHRDKEQNKVNVAPILCQYLIDTNFIDDICLYRNGEIMDTSCSLVDVLMGLHSEPGNLHVSAFFDILLQWFLSEDATNYRKTYVDTQLVWQN